MVLPMNLMVVQLLMMMIMIFGLVLNKNILLWTVIRNCLWVPPLGGYPGPQGLYYCSVGGRNTHGRDFVEEHADLCLEAGLTFEGINQEVARVVSGNFNCSQKVQKSW